MDSWITRGAARALIGLSVFTAGSSVSSAQDPAEDIPEVVVTATRIETDRSQVGSTVTVITSEELEDKQHTYVLDALREVPGVQIRRSGSEGSQTSIFMRGTDSDHTLLLVDGIQVHDPSSPTGAAELSHLLVQDIERIEIVRGPQSTVYGSDAIGGVINIITKRGKGTPRLTISAEAGSRDHFAESVILSGASEATDYRLSLHHTATEEDSASIADAEEDGYRNTSFSGRLGHQFTDSFRVDGYLRIIDDDIDIDSGNDFNASDTETRETLAKLEPSWTLYDGRWQTKVSLWAHDIERESDGVGFVLPSTSKGQIRGVDWQNTVAFGAGHTVTTGIELEEQEVERNVSGFAPFQDDVENRAIYLQDVWSVTDALTLTLGARVDDHEEFGTEPTFRGAAAYEIDSTGTIFRASAGTGFRAPSLSELFDTTFGSNDPDLDPEESIGFDIGVEQSFWGDRGTVGLTYFYNEIDDMIVTVFNSTTFAFVNENVEEVETQGAEFFVTLEPIENLTLHVNYTYTDTQAQEAASFGIRDGGRLLRRPLDSVNAHATYRFLDDRAQATVSYRYVGERKDLDPVTFSTVDADNYQIVDLAGSFRPREDLRIFGRVENIFDEDYEDVLGFNAPGVGFYGGLAYTFGGNAG